MSYDVYYNIKKPVSSLIEIGECFPLPAGRALMIHRLPSSSRARDLAAFLDFEASCKYPGTTHEIYVEGKTIVARRLPKVA